MNTLEKRAALRELNLGDVVKCSNGHEYEFIRLKKSKFIGKRSGQSYDIPVEMYRELVRKAEKTAFDPHTLEQGELFYILNPKQEAILYRFKYMINAERIMAENPVTGGGVRMPAQMAVGSVNDLAKVGGRR